MARTQHGRATLSAQVDLFLAGLGQGFNAYLERRGRIDEAERLDAKSDAELHRMGLSRDGIVDYVFRDAFAA